MLLYLIEVGVQQRQLMLTLLQELFVVKESDVFDMKEEYDWVKGSHLGGRNKRFLEILHASIT